MSGTTIFVDFQVRLLFVTAKNIATCLIAVAKTKQVQLYEKRDERYRKMIYRDNNGIRIYAREYPEVTSGEISSIFPQ